MHELSFNIKVYETSKEHDNKYAFVEISTYSVSRTIKFQKRLLYI